MTFLVAHQQPLLTAAAHVANGYVRQRIDVINTGATGERKEIISQVSDRQLKEGDAPRFSAVEPQLYVKVRHKLQVVNALRVVVEKRQKLVEIFRRGVIRTGCPDNH